MFYMTLSASGSFEEKIQESGRRTKRQLSSKQMSNSREVTKINVPLDVAERVERLPEFVQAHKETYTKTKRSDAHALLCVV